MKLTSLVLTAAVLSAAATTAFAQEAESDAWMQAGRASAATTVTAKAAPKAMPADRAQVRAEAAAALRSGELAVINAEAHDFALDRTVDSGTRLAKK